MELKTPYKVKCLTCGTENILDMELECVGSYERNMGPELEYMAAFDGVCQGCGEDILAQIEVWEYPIGTVEDYITVTKGAEKTEEPTFISHYMA